MKRKDRTIVILFARRRCAMGVDAYRYRGAVKGLILLRVIWERKL